MSTRGHWKCGYLAGHTSSDSSPHLTIGVLVLCAIMVSWFAESQGILQQISEPWASRVGTPGSQLEVQAAQDLQQQSEAVL